ncbi:hypothetical protein KD146_13895 [Devosia sp. BSSL-BM10]|uniref:Uncharacterized protein n=1 Tax=Devosia litorisediminis TaxID=2829817 RepID=A0A942IEU4_9HYPH|nr:hypothetical protein [Devosia litorisediminis]MBS3849790.1 hypothetical protein [Devosia litorisediminis]
MKTERFSLVAFFATLALSLTVLAGWKTFTLNSQAWHMWQIVGHNPLGALLSGHPHGLRYVLYYPVFAAAEFLGVTPDLAFSYVCVLVLYVMSTLVNRIDIDVWGSQGHVWRRDAVVFCIFALATLMNGRLLLAFCGYLFIIFAGANWFKCRKWKSSHATCVLIGCLLAGVSSGTLLAAMALSAGVVSIAYMMDNRLLKDTPLAAISIVIVLALFVSYALIGLGKNLVYYGGDESAVVRMLGHGAGGDIAKSIGLGDLVEQDDIPATGGVLGAALPYWWLGVVVAAFVARYYGWRPVQMLRTSSPELNLVHLSLVLAMVGGLFGYSVLMLGVIPFLLFASGNVKPVMLRLAASAQ